MLYKGYTVNEKFIGPDGNIAWQETGNGKFIIASLGGKEYFIKKNVNFRRPTRDIATVLRLEMGEEASRLETKQKKLATLMKGLSFDKDHIAVEESNFWDENDNLFVTVTRFLRDTYSNRSDFSKETIETKRDIFIQMATLIKKIHDVGVIHGDLKEPNFLFKKEGSRYILYLIDFDASYPASEVPEYNAVPYSPGYQSPEIVCYSASENPEMSYLLTPATDIFTLGLIFYDIWMNKLPSIPEGLEDMSVGEALARGEENKPILTKRLDEFIGDHTQATYLSLINWMLQRMPDIRPTADQVLAVLNDKESIPDPYVIGKDLRAMEELWLVDHNKAEFNPDYLKEQGVILFRKNRELGKNYIVQLKDKAQEQLTIEEIINRGLLKAQSIIICEPFEEHEIEFVDRETLKAKGVFKIERDEEAKKYMVTLSSGMRQYCSYKRMIQDGYAKIIEKEASTRFGEPWPEDYATFAPDDYLNEKHIESIEASVVNGVHGYIVTYNDGREAKFLQGKTMMLLGLLVPNKGDY